MTVTADKLEAYKERLLQMQLVLTKKARGLMSNMPSPEESSKGDSADQANGRNETELYLRLGQEDRDRLEMVRNALLRIEKDCFGSCAKCKKEISEPRLDALPYAVLCAKCKEKQDAKRAELDLEKPVRSAFTP